MRTILLGHKTVSGTDPDPALVAGPEVPRSKIHEIFTKAKGLEKKFPAGIKHLELCTIETVDRAIVIEVKTPKQEAAEAKAEAKQEAADAKAEAKAESKTQTTSSKTK